MALCVYNRETIIMNKLESRRRKNEMTETQNSKPEEGMETKVIAKAKRCQYTAEYKPRILRELDECTGKGDLGAVFRRGGMVSENAVLGAIINLTTSKKNHTTFAWESFSFALFSRRLKV